MTMIACLLVCCWACGDGSTDAARTGCVDLPCSASDSVDAGKEGGAVQAGTTQASGPPSPSATVESVVAAAMQLAGGDLVFVDARPKAAYEAGHLEGALSLDVDSLRGTVDGLSGQLLSIPEVAQRVGAAGISPEDPLLVYGDTTDLVATRLFWSLEVLGHRFVALLDGGFEKWRDAGLPIESGSAPSTTSSYLADRPALDQRVDAAFVLAHLEDPEVVLIDARSTAEYAAGHIPGALSFEWQTNLAAGRLEATETLMAMYADLPRTGTLVVYCQTGSRASMSYFVLRSLGFPDVRLYDGSMADWTRDSTRPLE